MSCVVWGCKSHSSRKENCEELLSFHRFPADDDKKKEWLNRIGRRNWTPKRHSHICSKHFTKDSFICATNNKWRRLREDAIPTLNIIDQTDELTSISKGPESQQYLHTVLHQIQDCVPMNFETVPCTSYQNNELELSGQTTAIPNQDCVPMNFEIVPSTSNEPEQPCPTTAIANEDCVPMDFEIAVPSTSFKIETEQSCKTISNRNQELSMLVIKTEEYKKKIKTLERDLAKIKKVSKRRLRKINTLTKRVSRLENKNEDLYSLLMEKLKKENIETEYITMLDKINENGVIKRFLDKQDGATSREYSMEVKKFAVTLNYLSPKAYNFIRDHFKNALPHPKTISTWYRSLDCSPGFTTEALNAIRSRVEQYPNKTLFCALALDEMAIRKMVEWDQHNNKYYGYVNVGCDLDSESVPLATQALTFMVTCLNDTWKIPVGYFLIKSISAQQKAMLVLQCIQLLQECGVKVVVLTFDGAATNIAMCTHLGCDIYLDSVSFKCGDSNIYVWPDPCHNIKLVRNTLGDKKEILDGENRIISWDHIERLLELQKHESLHLGTKLKREHVNYIKQKMKVRLATQLFSNSVADALQYCQDNSFPGFNDCHGTITFLRVFNNLFDIFNSRNMRAKGWKKALTAFNFEETEIFVEAAALYIRGLKLMDGTKIVDSNRKTGFNGFLVCMNSLLKVYNDVVVNDCLQYLCTYKMSQDHLELFFSAIRSKCGYNNNPSARGYQAAYKRLLVHAQFKDGSNGNCVPLERISVLNCSPSKCIDAINKSSGNVRMLSDEIVDSTNTVLSFIDDDHDYISSSRLTEYSMDVVHYIAGSVVRKLRKAIKCEVCLESLSTNTEECRTTLIKVKDRGGLIKPSKCVDSVCKTTEKVLREQIVKTGRRFLGRKETIMKMVNLVFSTYVNEQIFKGLIEHSFEQDFEQNHRNLLIKSICQTYLNIRIHHETKQENNTDEKIRSFLTKTILFKGQ